MLDYISKRLNEMVADSQSEVVTEEAVDYTDAILEYAEDIPELNDLSAEGQQTTQRPIGAAIDIPLDDDIELETIEINLTDGRLTDVPMDAAQMSEAAHLDAIAIQHLKSYDDFYAEAAEKYPQLTRYSQAVEDRRTAYAEAAYHKYQMEFIQESYTSKIPVNDSSVPYQVTIDFGPIKTGAEQHYYQTIPVYFQVDKNKVTKKQLDSVTLLVNSGLFNTTGEVLKTIMKDKYNFPDNKSPFDVLKPVKLYVPIEPVDAFKVMLALVPVRGGEEEILSLSWKIKDFEDRMKSAGKKSAIPEIGQDGYSAELTSIENKKEFRSKDEIEHAIEESYKLPTPSRFFQEEIDFGGDGGSAEASDTPAPAEDTPPAADDSTETPNEDKVEVDSNDVSQDIADKVAEDTTNDAPTTDDATADVTFDDADPEPTADVDLPADDTTVGDTDNTGDDVEAQLNDLDSMVGSEEPTSDADTTGDLDFDNMTIDQMLAQGTEKLKGMTIGQLKNFVSQEAAVDDEDGDFFDEAWVITRNNAAPTITDCITNCLGVLNDDTMDFKGITKQFKKSGKKLVHALKKSCNMKALFSEQDMREFKTLIHNTNEVQLAMTAAMKSNGDVSKAKAEILAFTKQAAEVSKITREFVKGDKYATPKITRKGF